MSGIIERYPLGFQWSTQDPFLFCVHHFDHYPQGNDQLGPAVSLAGRRIGNDFDLKNDWKMYHGSTVPGFPEHPHRGFETVTAVLEGYVDHFDSVGASGRYGSGDVQWMTAGKGIQHCEMFPLLNKETENTLHLFQIWLNLPKEDKFVKPHYKMLWREGIPNVMTGNEDGTTNGALIIAGAFNGVVAQEPAPDSWAANPDHHVDIWVVTLAPGGRFLIPNKSLTWHRNLYFYKGSTMTINGEKVEVDQRIQLENIDIEIINGDESSEMLVLQGEPINEPVVQYGPFVMNTEQEIQQAYRDFQETQFGGWPWDRPDPVYPAEVRRIARFEDGTEVRP